MRKYENWEKAFIILTYPEFGSTISDFLNRSKSSIRSIAIKIGIYKDNRDVIKSGDIFVD